MTVHIMRMSLPFVQLHLLQFYGIGNAFMGTVSASAYIMIGLGYLFLVFHPIQQVLPRYLLNMSIAGLAHILLFLTIMLEIQQPIVLVGCLMVAGFAQTAAYAVVMRLIYQHFESKSDGLLLGIWSAHGDAGNLFSFFINTVIFYSLGWSWRICLLFAGAITIIIAFILRFSLEERQEADRSFTKEEVALYLRRFCSQPLNGVLLAVVCLLKGTLYGILLWMPMYF